jgi:hypothetical protein
MATSTTITVPAHIAARIAARQQSGTKSSITAAVVGEGLNIPRISIRAGRYRLVEDGVETTVGITLDTIIVGANPRVSKVFYGRDYNPDDTAGPMCFSNDGIRPDELVQEPVNKSCADCPNNVLGSKVLPSGAKSKMCADQRHLGVVAAADPTKVYSMTVPVSGMKALREYFKELGNYGVNPEESVTEMGFDDTASYPKITFKLKSYVGEKMIERVSKLVDSDETKVATRQLPPPDRAPALAAPAQAAAAKLAATPPPAPAPVDDAYEEEQAAPAAATPAVKTKPTAAPVRASDELSAKLDTLFDA